MSDLDRIVELCKCEVSIDINEHTGVYQTIEEFLRESHWDECKERQAKCIEADRLVIVRAYKDTPVGFYVIVDSTIDAALTRMLAVLTEKETP